MRVISGKFRGKRLFAPADNRIRPTTDRIKESVFNILSSRRAVEGARVLDLFSGTGALGIEALSRGASEVIFVDIDRDSLELTRRNLLHVKADAAAWRTYHAEYKTALKKLEGQAFDLIFIDPPYSAVPKIDCIEIIGQSNILSKTGLIVFEHSAKNSLHYLEGQYIIDSRNMGDTQISFISLRE